MIRGAILEADARPAIPSASRRPERSTRRSERIQSPERPERSTRRSERRQSPERASTERSITPYRRYVPYRNPLEFRGLADERSGRSLPINIVQECGSLLSQSKQVIPKVSIIYCENLAVIS